MKKNRGPEYKLVNPPTVEQYVRAFDELRHTLPGYTRELLEAHYSFPQYTTTSLELERTFFRSSKGSPNTNRIYGGIGHQIADYLSFVPEVEPKGEEGWWTVVCTGWRDGAFYWKLRPEVVSAIEELEWVENTVILSPTDARSNELLVEGNRRTVLLNRYERSALARRKCIEAKGYDCVCCGMNFGKQYGPNAESYIEIHHLKPMAEKGKRQTNPANDLVPVCANCHAVIHLRNPCFTIDNVRKMLGRT